MINMNQGQSTTVTFQVMTTNNAVVGSSKYTVTPNISDPTVLQFNVDAFGDMSVKALKLGSASVSYTINAAVNSGYQGTLQVGPDQFTVVPLPLVSATDTYTTPA